MGSSRCFIVGGRRPSAAAPVTYGTNAYLHRTGSGLTGAADGKVGTVSFWFKFASDHLASIITGGPNTSIFNANVDIGFSTAGRPVISLYSGGGSTVRVQMLAAGDYHDGAWHHLLASWDANTGTRQMYIDDVSDVATSSGSNNNIDYTNVNWRMGSLFDGSRDLAPDDLAEFWFDFTTHLDLSVAANRRKFIRADGKPAFLGTNGEKPTGSSPILYINGPASGYGTNLGTGGNFSTSGTFTDEGTAVQL